jgi:hypothetical protein
MSNDRTDAMVDEVLADEAPAGSARAVVDFATRWWPVVGRIAWGMLAEPSHAVAVTEEVVGGALKSLPADGMPVRFLLYRQTIRLAIARRDGRLGAPTANPFLAALGRLDVLDRAALLLRDLEDLPAAESAAILEIPQAEVLRRLHRARLALTGISLEGGLNPPEC